MITRQWILAVLWELPLYYWPVFFWELAQLKAWWATNPVEPGTMAVIGVTPTGRIVLDGLIPPARPDPADWTRHAPRAPWKALDPEQAADALCALAGAGLPLHRHCTLTTPWLHRACTRLGPCEPLAPP